MMDNLDYQNIRDQVEAEVKRRKVIGRWTMFGVHVLIFVLFLIISWALVLANPDYSALLTGEDSPLLGAMLMLSIGWGTGIFMHGMSLFMDSGAAERQMRNQAITRAVGQEILERAAAEAEKPKRRLQHELAEDSAEDIVELSDDGELIARERRSSN